jgi:hypothetical protein
MNPDMVNKYVTVLAKSKWAMENVMKYGNPMKVGKVGRTAVMLVNPECTDVNDYNQGGFTWGTWIEYHEADFVEVVPCGAW